MSNESNYMFMLIHDEGNGKEEKVLDYNREDYQWYSSIEEAEKYYQTVNQPEEDYILRVEIVEIKPVKTVYTKP